MIVAASSHRNINCVVKVQRLGNSRWSSQWNFPNYRPLVKLGARKKAAPYAAADAERSARRDQDRTEAR